MTFQPRVLPQSVNWLSAIPSAADGAAEKSIHHTPAP